MLRAGPYRSAALLYDRGAVEPPPHCLHGGKIGSEQHRAVDCPQWESHVSRTTMVRDWPLLATHGCPVLRPFGGMRVGGRQIVHARTLTHIAIEHRGSEHLIVLNLTHLKNQGNLNCDLACSWFDPSKCSLLADCGTCIFIKLRCISRYVADRRNAQKIGYVDPSTRSAECRAEKSASQIQ
eukprot:4207601-Amphidinium_carterae.1